MNQDPCSLAESQKFMEAHEHAFRATVGCETEIKNRRDAFLKPMLGTSMRTLLPPQSRQYLTAVLFAALMEQVKTLVHMVGNLHLQFEHFHSTYSEQQHTRTTMQHCKRGNKIISRCRPSKCAPRHQDKTIAQLVNDLNMGNQDTSEETDWGRNLSLPNVTLTSLTCLL